MKNKLLIIGASGHGKVIADIALKMNRWNEISFLDDDESIKTVLGLEVIGKPDDALSYVNEYDIFVAVGNNATREKIQTKLESEGVNLPVLVHPTAVMGEQVYVESGTVVMAGVVINCCTTIGRGCIINTSASIDHDNVIGNFTHISPGVHLAGTVKLGHSTWLGIGSIVRNNVNIISGSIIGAGAVVIEDIKKPGTYVWIPARKIDP